jgi:hypothetical protein
MTPATTGEPQVRARHLQDWLALVAREPEPCASRFLEILGREMITEVEGAHAQIWLPAAYHVAMADALREAFGPTREHAYYRRAFVASMRMPVFGGLFKVGIRLFGLTPRAFIHWASKGWKVSFRNCGALEGTVLADNRGVLVYSDLPRVCTDSDAWLESAQSTIYGVLDVTRTDGVVRIDMSGRARGEMRVEIEWWPRA